MDYPTIKEVEAADREQIYRWFLGLPFPRLLREGKGKDARYVYQPVDGMKIIDRIFKRWLELGGREETMSMKILQESYPRVEIKDAVIHEDFPDPDDLEVGYPPENI